MIDKAFIQYFKAAHGFFNICMLALFSVQAWMGYQIRRARLSGAPMPVVLVRRHRKAGPVFALWGGMGALAGAVLVLLDKGRIFEHRLHLTGGLTLTILLYAAYQSSRQIRGADAEPRDMHYKFGALLLILYFVQALLGIAILL